MPGIRKGSAALIIELGRFNHTSPYNTYLHKGLPPTPICNPSLDSLETVVNPPQTDYYFCTGREWIVQFFQNL